MRTLGLSDKTPPGLPGLKPSSNSVLPVAWITRPATEVRLRYCYWWSLIICCFFLLSFSYVMKLNLLQFNCNKVSYIPTLYIKNDNALPDWKRNEKSHRPRVGSNPRLFLWNMRPKNLKLKFEKTLIFQKPSNPTRWKFAKMAFYAPRPRTYQNYLPTSSC